MSLNSLPLFVRLGGRPVILLGEGEPAEAKRRLLDRAGARVVGEDAAATLAIVAIEDEDAAQAAIARLKARGILVNAVDRPAACDFTLPAIVERGPVIVAIGTGGVSAGLAAALRQRLETLLPAGLGALAEGLFAARSTLRARFPDGAERRRAIGAALSPGGALDPLAGETDVEGWLASADRPAARVEAFVLTSTDPDDLTLRQARALAAADRVYHRADVPPAILDRARADAVRIESDMLPADASEGQVVDLSMAARA
ncbi:NAD(P)-dependent oxidoreductase [Sphingomonas pseudosanguinis]|uniref:precorrin-2 dehydrogenase n=1 Tax=Sphingomonas pseudosanguinis TaxID=413712 RepID=A0A7W6A5R1_9SPHN|nr:uroporphyrin-III C-methyltransferase/precorrin-2 dehydrogenase/sirohydrochlorin ferrochelatase [Sphingomonas pseudosanguinis]MBN3537518.1 bifunctional precorrin-2 dehydrogenase/sirohydrochlorin ferrochelatase [Sphingomonas pseudosanguinis]